MQRRLDLFEGLLSGRDYLFGDFGAADCVAGRSCATPWRAPARRRRGLPSGPVRRDDPDGPPRPPARVDRARGARRHRVAPRALLGYGRAMEAHSAGRRARARAIGWLVAGGAAMVLIWVALPHPDAAHDGPAIALVVATWVLAALLLAGRFDRASRLGTTLVLAVAATLISGTLLAIGDPASGFALFYVCLAPYAFAATAQRYAIGLTVFIAVLYAARPARARADEPDAVVADALAGRWIVVVCGCIALGLFARHLAALRRFSEDRFQRGFADSPVGMAIISADWRWVEVNDALCRLLGRTREQLIGRSPADVDAPRGHRPQPRGGRPRARRQRAAAARQALPAARRRGRVGGGRLDLRARAPRRGLVLRARPGHHGGARRAGGGGAPGAPAVRGRGARPLRARRAGPRGGHGPRRRDRRRDARRRALRGLRDHAARHGAAARRRHRLARRARAPGARARRARRRRSATRSSSRSRS